MKFDIGFQRFNLGDLNTDDLKVIWKRLFYLTWLCVFFFVLMEWIFFITKPSFMNYMEPVNQFSLLLLTNLAFFLPTVPLFLILVLLSKTISNRNMKKVPVYLYVLIPSLFIAVAGMLILDNFTYTVFRFGIVSAQGPIRIVYLLGFVVLSFAIYRGIISTIRVTQNNVSFGRRTWIINLLIIVPLLSLLVRADWNNIVAQKESSLLTSIQPNIILLSSDGLDAAHMSVYGYSRNTTPYLDKLGEGSLLSQNAFTNCGRTPGAIASVLTSKLPFETRVIFPPDILHGSDEYEHLPGILRTQGYFTVQMGIPYYVDASAINLRDGFDIVNGRSSRNGFLYDLIGKFDVDNLPYFWEMITERVSDRLLHIFYLRDMLNPYQMVISATNEESDQQKIDQMIKIIDSTDQPVFIQAHLLGTHSPFTPSVRVFSAGLDANENTEDEFYDDTVLNFDRLVGEIAQYLEESGKISDTILVIYSDHASGWSDIGRVPLIIHFPRDEYKGIIAENTQDLDIAPTILSYMGIPIPDWMSGVSLISAKIDASRPIYSTNIVGVNVENDMAFLSKAYTNPPFFQFPFVDAFICQSITRLNLIDKVWEQSEVNSYFSPCDIDTLPELSDIQKETLNLLKISGFDISSVEKDLPVVILTKKNQ